MSEPATPTTHPAGPIHDRLHEYFAHVEDGGWAGDADDVDDLAAFLIEQFGTDLDIAQRARTLKLDDGRFNEPYTYGWDDCRAAVLGEAAT